jgi:hypothetical protein
MLSIEEVLMIRCPQFVSYSTTTILFPLFIIFTNDINNIVLTSFEVGKWFSVLTIVIYLMIYVFNNFTEYKGIEVNGNFSSIRQRCTDWSKNSENDYSKTKESL